MSDDAQATHIAIVGLMGSGKTTVGRLVGDRLGIPFRDNDDALTDAIGLTASELAARDGAAALHDVEARVLLHLLAEPEPAVIAVAASTIEVPACREALDRDAFVVWLHADIEVLAARASRGRHRPLHDDVVAQLREQASARSERYRSVADLTVDVGSHDAAAAAAHIAAAAMLAGRH